MLANGRQLLPPVYFRSHRGLRWLYFFLCLSMRCLLILVLAWRLLCSGCTVFCADG